jgi:UrcA family protein
MIKTALALAAATLLCAAPAAAQTVRVPFGDLNLSTAAGAEAFDARVAEAGREVCTTGSARLVNTSCVKRIQREAVRELPRSDRDDYARARRGERILAMVVPSWPA